MEYCKTIYMIAKLKFSAEMKVSIVKAYQGAYAMSWMARDWGLIPRPWCPPGLLATEY